MNIDASLISNPLKPCPECESTKVRLKARVAYGTYWYECKRCGYRAAIGHSIEEAVEKWNDGKEAG